MTTKTHWVGVYGRSNRLRVMARDLSTYPYIDLREHWSVTGSANVEEARRRVARVKAGALDVGVLRLK